MPLGNEVGLAPGDTVLDGDQKWDTAPPYFSAHVLWPNGWMDQDPLDMEVGIGPGHIVLDRDPATPPPKGAQQPFPSFRPMSIVAKRSPISATAEHLLKAGYDMRYPLLHL